ncbi:MAG: cytochrome ubiquinol oxidase subunit I [Thermoguttaceae bacterium]
MHFPWWYVPVLTAPMLIAVVSIVHMLVAHYAVGGGLFLAVEANHAYRTQNLSYLVYLKRHARFFVLVTVVLGAVTGVGIWWTIGLASPLATRILLQTFVFAWAVEWVCFLVEIVSAFVFYYYWDRLPQKIHTTVLWIYAVAGWSSLAIISAITAFMLDPGDWLKDHDFWSALFNRQALPQVVSRTGGAMLLSSLYVYLHAAMTIKDATLQALIEKRSTRPALLGAVLIAVGGGLWYVLLPDSAQAALTAAPVLNVFMGVLFGATAVVFVLLYLGPYRNPGWIYSPGFAVSLLLFGFAGFSTGEFIREAVRKPYIIYNYVLGNQVVVTPEEIKPLKDFGLLNRGHWALAYVKARYPQCVPGDKIDWSQVRNLAPIDRIQLGGVIFQHHCNDCHALNQGYSPVAPLVQGWSAEMIRELVQNLDQHRFVMPPWCGTTEEADLLTDYLQSIAPQRPTGMLPSPQGKFAEPANDVPSPSKLSPANSTALKGE